MLAKPDVQHLKGRKPSQLRILKPKVVVNDAVEMTKPFEIFLCSSELRP